MILDPFESEKEAVGSKTYIENLKLIFHVYVKKKNVSKTSLTFFITFLHFFKVFE